MAMLILFSCFFGFDFGFLYGFQVVLLFVSGGRLPIHAHILDSVLNLWTQKLLPI